MSLPTGSIEGGSNVLLVVSPNTYFEAKRTVTSGKNKWILTEIDGQTGWVKKSHTDKVGYSFLFIGLGVLLTVALIVVVALKLRKRKKK